MSNSCDLSFHLYKVVEILFVSPSGKYRPTIWLRQETSSIVSHSNGRRCFDRCKICDLPKSRLRTSSQSDVISKILLGKYLASKCDTKVQRRRFFRSVFTLTDITFQRSFPSDVLLTDKTRKEKNLQLTFDWRKNDYVIYHLYNSRNFPSNSMWPWESSAFFFGQHKWFILQRKKISYSEYSLH